MNIELQGKIVNVLPEQRGNGSKGEWVKHAFVVEWQDGGFTQKLCLEVIGQDKWEKVSKAVVVGHDVLCKFNVSSREYNGKYYTTASCFYCSTVGNTNTQQQQTQQHQPQQDSGQDEPLPF